MLKMLPVTWMPKASERVLKALDECSNPDMPLRELQAICLDILPEIKDDRKLQYQIVESRVKANDQAGVQWLLADPQRFPACYTDGRQIGNALDLAARTGHMDMLLWLVQDENAQYWSETEQSLVRCYASPYTLYAAVEGGNLDVVRELTTWFPREVLPNSEVYNWKRDTELVHKAVAGLCQEYTANRQQGEGLTWQNGKQFEVLEWLRQQGVAWDKDSMGAAAKAGHLELIDWLAAEKTLRQCCMQSPYVCTMAIQNPDQDEAIKTLKHLLNRGFPWKPYTRAYRKEHGSNRQEEKPGLCETAASLGKLKVLKWLANDPDALLPLCQGKFEMRNNGSTSTGIPLTPWEDGNLPGRIRDVAKKGLEARDFTEQAIKIGMPAERMHEVTLATWFRNTAELAAKEGVRDAAARYQGLADQVESEIQAYKDTLAWLDSEESGYTEHVKQQKVHYQRLRDSLRTKDKQEQQQQQQQGASTSAAAANAAAAAGHADLNCDEVI